MEFKVKIIDPIGLHARPATALVQVANKFESEMEIKFKNKQVNLKSIMLVMGLGVETNNEVTIIANGSDEEEAINAIKEVMKTSNLI